MWVDKHAPRTSAELAVHKKKVEEVRAWLQRADASLQLGLPPTPRMLVLSGPPGSGKSTMLRVIAEELHYELCEWIEPRTDAFVAAADRPFDPDRAPYESRMTQFGTFLRSSLRTLSLTVTSAGSGGGAAAASSSTATAASSGYRRRLVVLDELPNTSAGGNDDMAR